VSIFRILTGFAIFAAVLSLFAIFGSQQSGVWYSVVPPLAGVVLAFVTRRLLWSLLAAMLLGALLVAIEQGETASTFFPTGIGLAFTYAYKALLDPWSLKILGFVFCILSMISVIILSGGLKGIVTYLQRYSHGARSSQLMTAVLGLLVFIDDYANTMIVGSAMRPVTDSHRVSREKLAFIIDATSAPVAGLAVISTWIGYETGLFTKVSESLQIGLDGYSMFFDALAFRFYCVLMLLFVFLNIIMQREFGAMHRISSSSLGSNSVSPQIVQHSHSGFSMVDASADARISAWSAILPLGLMMFTLLGGLWIDGKGLSLFQQSLFAPLLPWMWMDVITQAKNSSTILLLSASVGLIAAAACATFIAHVSWAAIARAAYVGVRSSLLPVGILVLAWSLKSACDALGTGEFLAHSIGQVLQPFWFPLLLFAAAALTSFGTGTSWGTMAILIPTAIPVAYALDGNQYGLITMISLGAVLDGAIFGDHCSPISDTTIMSSIASGCDHLEHVRTQIPYSLTVALTAALCGYIPVALEFSPLLSYVTGFFVLWAILYFSPRAYSRVGASPDNG